MQFVNSILLIIFYVFFCVCARAASMNEAEIDGTGDGKCVCSCVFIKCSMR